MSLNLAQPDTVAIIRSEIGPRAMVQALRMHPEWRLGDLELVMARSSRRTEQLRQVKTAELQPAAPLLDEERRARAEQLQGSSFDRIMLEVIAGAGDWVSASYIRARAGGPRWKLLQSVGRLIDAGQWERRGKTSATQYRAVKGAS